MDPKNDIDLTQVHESNFLARNRISDDDWLKANIDYDALKSIGLDHTQRVDQLAASAAFFASEIQKFDAVHSVRWRIKNPEHLMKKIVRKRASGESKYQQISRENYHEIVTDLIGIRALHLFKEDCFAIDGPMRDTWALAEDAVAYVRQGDEGTIIDRLQSAGFTVKSHPAGYRSVHYVFSSQPLARKVFAEVQVRTIFEEGWSEIDHTVRYPNFSDNKLVAYFLAIFNRMAGSADEMGAFVKGLIQTLNEADASVAAALRDKDATLTEMNNIVEELEDLKQQDAKSRMLISNLRSKLNHLTESKGALSTIYGLESLDKRFAEVQRTIDLSHEMQRAIDLTKQLNSAKAHYDALKKIGNEK